MVRKMTHKKTSRPRPRRPRIVQAVLDAYGSAAAAAAAFKVSRQAIQKWRYVPAEYALAIEAYTGGRIRAHDVAPKAYPKWLHTWPRPAADTANGAAARAPAPPAAPP